MTLRLAKWSVSKYRRVPAIPIIPIQKEYQEPEVESKKKKTEYRSEVKTRSTIKMSLV